MDTKDIVFVHGWGEDSRIWEGITEHLPGFNHHFIDLGFIGEESDSDYEIVIPEVKSPMYVTHSLGTTWVLNNIPLKQISALVAINGFGRFADFASNETLKIMSKSLQRNIFLQMEMFWKNCNFPENMRQTYKHELRMRELSQGLSWLSSWDKSEKLQDLKTKGVPVLSLGGEKDLILPPEIMRAHWNGLGCNVVMNEQAGHALPITHPKWCAQEITGQIERLIG